MESFRVYGKCGQPHPSMLRFWESSPCKQCTLQCISECYAEQNKPGQPADKAAVQLCPPLDFWQLWVPTHAIASAPSLQNSLNTSKCLWLSPWPQDTIIFIYFPQGSYDLSRIAIKKACLKRNWTIEICDSVENLFKYFPIFPALQICCSLESSCLIILCQPYVKRKWIWISMIN